MTPQHKWREKNPIAAWAHQCLRSALKRGLVTKEPCAKCGDDKSEAHHPDYDAPKAVIWLCRRCHKAVHRNTHKRETANVGGHG
jgi:hypothetical protein